MNEQSPLPGVAPTKILLPAKHKVSMFLNAGAQAELTNLENELKTLQKQHPSAPGLTIALCVVQRRLADHRMDGSRILLGQAAKAGMPIENHSIASRLVGDEIEITAEPGDGA